MMKSNYKKIFVYIFSFIFIIASIFSINMANNSFHIDNCEKVNCTICAFIVIAREFVENIIFININAITVANIIVLIKIIKSKINIEKKLTLIELKVIQNK